MMTARDGALYVIGAFRKSASWSDAVTDKLIKNGELAPEDRALCRNIALGTVQNMTYLDYIIAEFCSMPLKKLHPMALDILRISAYQILFLDGIPDSAAVNEAVKLTKKKVNQKASGLVNAVLRKLSQSKENLPEIKAKDMAEKLAIRYSHDLWLAKTLIDEIGVDATEMLFAYDNQRPETVIHTNLLKCSSDELCKYLSENGIEYDAFSGVSNCFVIKNAGKLFSLDAFKNGFFYVQGASAHAAALIADAKSNERVLDVCSAPGGKAIASAIAMENSGEVIACDIHDNKLKRIRDNAERLGIDIIKTECRDASEYNVAFDSAFDVVIADVPCSGFGVIRSKPEIRYKSDEDTMALPEIQLAIINNVSRYVKIGGVLVYSTCTVLDRENRLIIDSFLAENSGFVLEPFSALGKNAESGMLTFLPHIHNTDGFFAAKLRRIK